MSNRWIAIFLLLAATVATVVTTGTRVALFAVAAATCGCLWLLVSSAHGRGRAAAARLAVCAIGLTALTTCADRPMVEGDTMTVYPSFGVPAPWITQAQIDEQPGVTELAYLGSLDDNRIAGISGGRLLFDIAAYALLLAGLSRALSSASGRPVADPGSRVSDV